MVRDGCELFRVFPGSQSSSGPVGPIGKIVALLQGLGLQLDTGGSLWFSANGFIPLWTTTDTLLKHILLRAYPIINKPTFSGLDLVMKISQVLIFL